MMQMFNSFFIYLFSPTPGRAFQYYNFIVILIVVLTILGIVLRVYIRKNRDDKPFRKLFKKFPSKLWILAILFTLYLLVRHYYVPFFSMRFLLYILLGATIYLAYKIINIYLKTYPEEKKLREKTSRPKSLYHQEEKEKKEEPKIVFISKRQPSRAA